MIVWKNTPALRAGTTLRDPSAPEYNNTALHCGGDPTAILANRQRLADALQISCDQFIFAQQTHSDHIVKVGYNDKGKGAFSYDEAIADCDALYTQDRNLLIGVFSADCVPILLYDPIKHIIAAIHSGWMGTCKGILSKTLTHLIEQEGCSSANIQAYIGPAISFSSFEIGMEVVAQLRQLPFDVSPFIRLKDKQKAYADNKGINYQMLRNAGVPPANITMDQNDTFSENEVFFSYRRDHNCGRHLSFIIQH